jgi:hypothetical protein
MVEGTVPHKVVEPSMSEDGAESPSCRGQASILHARSSVAHIKHARLAYAMKLLSLRRPSGIAS